MKAKPVNKDERTTAVENASFRWAYFLLSFGVLIDVAYRGLVLNQSNWDLMVLVILAGFVATLYQSSQKILTKRWIFLVVGVVFMAAAVAAIIVFAK
jgi:hypothetical protein